MKLLATAALLISSLSSQQLPPEISLHDPFYRMIDYGPNGYTSDTIDPSLFYVSGGFTDNVIDLLPFYTNVLHCEATDYNDSNTVNISLINYMFAPAIPSGVTFSAIGELYVTFHSSSPNNVLSIELENNAPDTAWYGFSIDLGNKGSIDWYGNWAQTYPNKVEMYAPGYSYVIRVPVNFNIVNPQEYVFQNMSLTLKNVPDVRKIISSPVGLNPHMITWDRLDDHTTVIKNLIGDFTLLGFGTDTLQFPVHLTTATMNMFFVDSTFWCLMLGNDTISIPNLDLMQAPHVYVQGIDFELGPDDLVAGNVLVL